MEGLQSSLIYLNLILGYSKDNSSFFNLKGHGLCYWRCMVKIKDEGNVFWAICLASLMRILCAAVNIVMFAVILVKIIKLRKFLAKAKKNTKIE